MDMRMRLEQERGVPMVVEPAYEVRAEVNYLHNRTDDAGAALDFWSEEDAAPP